MPRERYNAHMKTLAKTLALICVFAAIAAHAAEPNPASAQMEYRGLYAALEGAAFSIAGQKNPKSVIYVFFDPNCPYCRHAWLALRHYEKVGLQTRWVPVGVLKQSSMGRAAAILEAADRSAALYKNESEYQPARAEGGMAPLANPKPETLARLKANYELMRSFNFRGVPALVWKDAAGAINARPGMPRMQDLPGMTGLPEQWIDDPELDAYR